MNSGTKVCIICGYAAATSFCADIKWLQLWSEFVKSPTFLVGSYWAGLSPAAGMELCCLLGVALAIAVTLFDIARSAPVMLLLWLLYLSVYKVGQVFLWFQW